MKKKKNKTTTMRRHADELNNDVGGVTEREERDGARETPRPFQAINGLTEHHVFLQELL